MRKAHGRCGDVVTGPTGKGFRPRNLHWPQTLLSESLFGSSFLSRGQFSSEGDPQAKNEDNDKWELESKWFLVSRKKIINRESRLVRKCEHTLTTEKYVVYL